MVSEFLLRVAKRVRQQFVLAVVRSPTVLFQPQAVLRLARVF